MSQASTCLEPNGSQTYLYLQTKAQTCMVSALIYYYCAGYDRWCYISIYPYKKQTV